VIICTNISRLYKQFEEKKLKKEKILLISF